MIVKVLKSNRALGIREGEQYKAIPSFANPKLRLILFERVTDGYNPYCAELRENLQLIMERVK